MSKVSKKSSNICSICHNKLSSPKLLAKHMNTIHKPKEFLCDYDGKCFNTKDKLRLHMYKHRKYYKIKCQVCDREYVTDQSMRKHLRTHFQQHQCDHCGMVFKYKRLLENHIDAIHEDLQAFQCKFCTRLFPTTTTRDSHQKTIHKDRAPNTKFFKCTECAAGFEMKEELRIHSFIHFNGTIHTCLDCNQIFKKKKLLTMHMKKHELPSYLCVVCNQLFKYKSNLSKHLKKGRCKEKESSVDNGLSGEIAEIAKRQMLNITKNYTRSIVKPDGDDDESEIDEEQQNFDVESNFVPFVSSEVFDSDDCNENSCLIKEKALENRSTKKSSDFDSKLTRNQQLQMKTQSIDNVKEKSTQLQQNNTKKSSKTFIINKLSLQRIETSKITFKSTRIAHKLSEIQDTNIVSSLNTHKSVKIPQKNSNSSQLNRHNIELNKINENSHNNTESQLKTEDLNQKSIESDDFDQFTLQSNQKLDSLPILNENCNENEGKSRKIDKSQEIIQELTRNQQNPNKNQQEFNLQDEIKSNEASTKNLQISLKENSLEYTKMIENHCINESSRQKSNIYDSSQNLLPKTSMIVEKDDDLHNLNIRNDEIEEKSTELDKLAENSTENNQNYKTTESTVNPVKFPLKNPSKTPSNDENNRKSHRIITKSFKLNEASRRSYNKQKPSRAIKPTITSTYICDICGYEVHIKAKFLSHIRLHVASNRHKCKYCNENFRSMKNLHFHSMKIHNRGVYGSLEYSKSFSDCEICGKTLSAERMKTHMSLHEMPKIVCDHCGKFYRTKAALNRHLSVAHDSERKFTCSICGKTYKKMSILKQHEETHNPIKIYIKCENCAKIMQMKHLKMHMEVQHGGKYSEKHFQCHCGKQFRYQKQLDKHNEQVHEAKNRGIFYSCGECERVFTRRHELRNHSFAHYNGPVYECTECKLKFKKKKLLYIHSRVHSNGDLAYACDQCQSAFKTKGGLRKHSIKMHANNE